MRISRRGIFTLKVIGVLILIVIISKLPNAEPEEKSDGPFYIVNHATGDYNER